MLRFLIAYNCFADYPSRVFRAIRIRQLFVSIFVEAKKNRRKKWQIYGIETSFLNVLIIHLDWNCRVLIINNLIIMKDIRAKVFQYRLAAVIIQYWEKTIAREIIKIV